MHRRSFLLASTGLVAGIHVSFPAFAADKAGYEKLVKDVIGTLVAKNFADIDGLVTKLDAAAKIGVELCKEVAATDAANKAIIEFAIANFDKIRATPADKFEDEWHEGAAFKAAGHDNTKLDQTGKAASAIDSVIHPLTSRAALLAYKTSKKPELIKTAIEELEEVLGHLKHL
jgi:hypothetical protein